MIRLENVYAGYNNKVILKDINITFEDGKITTIIGPNGSGKSTIIKVISRIIRPFDGKIFIDDKPLHEMSLKDLARIVSVLHQMRTVPSIDVETLVSSGRFPYTGFFKKLDRDDKYLVEKAMKEVDIIKFRHKNLREMSGGERQKAFIAMTLAQDTKFILLDEPTTFLDINHQLDILRLMQKLKKMGKTIIMVLHDLTQAISYSDKIVVIDNGRVVDADVPSKIVERGIVDRVFKVKTKCFYDDEKAHYFFE